MPPRSTRPRRAPARPHSLHFASSSRTSARCSDGRVGDAEVDQCEALGLPALDLLERAEPALDVDVRRRRDRQHVAGSARCGRRPRRPRRASRRRAGSRRGATRGPGEGKHSSPSDAVADDLDVLLRHGRELAPEDVERVAVEPARARLEPARVDDVRRADLRDVHAAARGARGRASRRRRRGRGGCGRAAGGGRPSSSSPRSARPAFSASMQVDGPAVVEREPVVGLDAGSTPTTRSVWWWRSIGSAGTSIAKVRQLDAVSNRAGLRD